MAGRPGTRPWAWREFDAPEPLGEHESERDYLERVSLFMSGEEQLPTLEDQEAAKQAEIQARIDANLRNIQCKLGRSTTDLATQGGHEPTGATKVAKRPSPPPAPERGPSFA
jgi:hypothetical protein